MIWSAMPVHGKKFLPVFRFYASLPRISLLQGIAATGVYGYSSLSFVGLRSAQTSVPKPDCSEHEVQRSKAQSGAANLQALQATHFLILNTNII